MANRDCCSMSCLPLAQICLRSSDESQQEIGQGYNNGQTPFWHIPDGKKYETIDGLLASIYETDDGTPQEQIFTVPVDDGTQIRFGDVDSVPITKTIESKSSQECLAIGKKVFHSFVIISSINISDWNLNSASGMRYVAVLDVMDS